MAFNVPQFPLTVGLYSGPWLTKAFREEIPGNLQFARRVHSLLEFVDVGSVIFNGPVYLLVPADTDIRDLNQDVPDNDIVEVPADSGRWYAVALVEDVAKGFDNEFRIAVIWKISENVDAAKYPGLWWPVPMP